MENKRLKKLIKQTEKKLEILGQELIKVAREKAIKQYNQKRNNIYNNNNNKQGFS